MFQPTSKLGNRSETKPPQEQDGVPNNAPISDTPRVKPPKQSLHVENENMRDTEVKLTPAPEKDPAGAVKPLSIKSEPSLPLNVGQQARKPEPPRTLNIRKETDPGVGFLCASDDDDNDLFSSSAFKVNPKPALPPKQPVKPTVSAKPETSSSSSSKPQILKPVQSMSKPLDQEVTAPIKRELSEVDGAAVSVSKLRNSLLGRSSAFVVVI